MILEIQELKKAYANQTVVDITHLIINPGETVGVIGNNGAGKTTLFRMLLDLIRPDSGEIRSKNSIVSSSGEWKNYTASFLDEGFLIGYLTPEEYFEFIGHLHGKNASEVAVELLAYEEFFNGEILNSGKYIRDFSKGNQNKIGIATALLQKPEILILDEPFANLDPTTQIRLKNQIKQIRNTQKVTTLISSHDLNHVTDICDRIILFEKGQVIKDLQTNEDTLMELETYFSR